MPIRVALDIYRDRKTRDMAGMSLYMHGKSCNPSAKTHGPYAEVIYLIKQIAFNNSNLFIRIRASDAP